MERKEWLKRLQAMQADMDERGILMEVGCREEYLVGSVLGFVVVLFNGEDNGERWRVFEEKVKKVLPWWDVE